jgi:MFS family permease
MIITILIFILLIIALGVSAFYLVGAAKDVDGTPSHKDLTIASIIGWVGLGLLVGLVGLYVVFGSETAGETGGLFSKAMLFLAVGVILATGIFGIMGTVKLDKNKKSHKKAYDKAIIGSSIAFSAAMILIIWKIITFIKKHHK